MVAQNQSHNVSSFKCVHDSVYQIFVYISGLYLQLITFDFFSEKEVQTQVELFSFKTEQVQQLQALCCFVNVIKMHALINLSTVSYFLYDPLSSTTSSGLIRLRPTHWSKQLPCSQVISPEAAQKRKGSCI